MSEHTMTPEGHAPAGTATGRFRSERRALVFGALAAGTFAPGPSIGQTKQEGVPMHIDRFDHMVLTVADVEATCAFYRDACGMEVVTFGAGRKALKFGNQKINLHPAGHEIDPKALRPTPGSADFCLITSVPVEAVKRHLESLGLTIEEGGIVDRTGATGPIRSVYVRDPDRNLVEISNYPDRA